MAFISFSALLRIDGLDLRPGLCLSVPKRDLNPMMTNNITRILPSFLPSPSARQFTLFTVKPPLPTNQCYILYAGTHRWMVVIMSGNSTQNINPNNHLQNPLVLLGVESSSVLTFPGSFLPSFPCPFPDWLTLGIHPLAGSHARTHVSPVTNRDLDRSLLGARTCTSFLGFIHPL